MFQKDFILLMFKTSHKMLFGLNRKVALTVPNNDKLPSCLHKIWHFKSISFLLNTVIVSSIDIKIMIYEAFWSLMLKTIHLNMNIISSFQPITSLFEILQKRSISHYKCLPKNSIGVNLHY